jgi:hypothetical protein
MEGGSGGYEKGFGFYLPFVICLVHPLGGGKRLSYKWKF